MGSNEAKLHTYVGTLLGQLYLEKSLWNEAAIQFSSVLRNVRNNMLTNRDTKINEDMPDAVKQPWLDYRKKLRDLPTDWSGIGTSTYLVAWPIAPDEKGGAFRP